MADDLARLAQDEAAYGAHHCQGPTEESSDVYGCMGKTGNSMEKPQLLPVQITAIENDRNISAHVYRNYQRGPKLLTAELLKPAEAPISRPRRPNILSDR